MSDLHESPLPHEPKVPPESSQPEKSDPKMEADKLIQELLIQSQAALVKAMKQNGMSESAMQDLGFGQENESPPIEMIPGVTWQQYHSSSEREKSVIAQNSQNTIDTFKEGASVSTEAQSNGYIKPERDLREKSKAMLDQIMQEIDKNK